MLRNDVFITNECCMSHNLLYVPKYLSTYMVNRNNVAIQHFLYIIYLTDICTCMDMNKHI